jgi:hypothetical protein
MTNPANVLAESVIPLAEAGKTADPISARKGKKRKGARYAKVMPTPLLTEIFPEDQN